MFNISGIFCFGFVLILVDAGIEIGRCIIQSQSQR